MPCHDSGIDWVSIQDDEDEDVMAMYYYYITVCIEGGCG